MQNIYLVGFMGTGKTAVGQVLAKTLGLYFFDLDDIIAQKEKRSINEIFNQSGEPYFRQVEGEVLKEVSLKNSQVISCGGGIVINPKNIAVMKQTGKVICLSARPEAIYQRIKGDTSRPLLEVADPKARIKELLDARRPFYEKADFMIDTSDRPIEEVSREIMQKIK